MPQLFMFLYCLNPKSGGITAQNNLWPLSTCLGLSPSLLSTKQQLLTGMAPVHQLL